VSVAGCRACAANVRTDPLFPGDPRMDYAIPLGAAPQQRMLPLGASVCGASHETASETLSPQPRAAADEVDSLGSCSIVERVEQTELSRRQQLGVAVLILDAQQWNAAVVVHGSRDPHPATRFRIIAHFVGEALVHHGSCFYPIRAVRTRRERRARCHGCLRLPNTPPTDRAPRCVGHLRPSAARRPS